MARKVDDILTGPKVPDPVEPTPLKAGDPHPPPDTLAKLRAFIPCRTGLSWQWLQHEVRSLKGEHTLTVNKAWTHIDAPAHSVHRLKPELWTGGPLFADSNLVLGQGTLEFCKAVKTLLDEGQLQVLMSGVMKHAIDPVTGYWYQHEPPKLPGLHVTITPGD